MPEGQGVKARWDFEAALTKARERMAAASSGVPDDPREATDDVQFAMAHARRAAPALVNLIQALTLGTDPEELDLRRGGVRIMAELAVRQLAIIGMKAGETVELDVSDRLKQALGLFFRTEPEPVHGRVIEHGAQQALDE